MFGDRPHFRCPGRFGHPRHSRRLALAGRNLAVRNLAGRNLIGRNFVRDPRNNRIELFGVGPVDHHRQQRGVLGAQLVEAEFSELGELVWGARV